MGKIGQSLRDARLEMEQILKVSEKLADNFSDQGGAGGGGGAAGAPTAPPAPVVRQVINFNTTIAPPLVGGGSGGAGGGGGSFSDSDLARIGRAFGISVKGKSDQYLQQLLDELNRLSKKIDSQGGGVQFRMGGGG